MKSNFQIQSDVRAAEIDERAADLVRKGSSPYEAIQRAAREVDRERQRRAADSKVVTWPT